MKKAFKITDENMVCRGYQFNMTDTFVQEGDAVLCKNGFHFCNNVGDLFGYYNFDSNNRVFEIEYDENNVDTGEDKLCSNKIRFIRELAWHEVLDMANSGNHNSGNRNSGNRNSGNRNSGNRNSGDYNSGDRNNGNCNSGDWNNGDCNSGDWNSGDYNSGDLNSGDCNSGNRNSGHGNSGLCNSGDCNSGDYNSCDHSSGFFNSINENVYMFNKPTDMDYKAIFEKLCEIDIFFDVILCYSDGEEHKIRTHKEAWKEWYDRQESNIDEKLKQLPNFDADVFEEITGLRIK